MNRLSPKEQEEIILASNEYFGFKNRLKKTNEECAELIQAICKYQISKKSADLDHICDEVADVEIIISALKKFLPTDRLEFYRQRKLERLKRRISGEEDEDGSLRNDLIIS